MSSTVEGGFVWGASRVWQGVSTHDEVFEPGRCYGSGVVVKVSFKGVGKDVEAGRLLTWLLLCEMYDVVIKCLHRLHTYS